MGKNRFIRRHRTLFLIGGALIALALSLQSDPDSGISTFLGAVALAQAVWAIAGAHWARKALHDYPEADMQTLFRKALESPIGAGLALISLAIIFVGLLAVFSQRAHAGDLPAGFLKYGPVLQAEQRHFWPDHPDPAVLAALVEQESCVSLKSPKCWNPGAQLKATRKDGSMEEGAGMGQITRAWRKDGSLRMDSLSALKVRYGAELDDWSWNNVYQRADLQLRAIVLMSRDAARPFRSALKGMLPFGDAAYNGGPSDVQRERRACKLTPGCDPGQWFGNVEKHCLKSRQPIYGGRSACDINREHVRNVMLIRRPRYEGLM